MTITTTVAQDARIAAAYGAYLGLTSSPGVPRNATLAEIKTEVFNEIRAIVANYEKQKAESAAIATADATLTDLGTST